MIKKTFLFIFSFFYLFLSELSAQDITGSWGGKLDIMGKKLPIVFNIEKKDTLYVTQMDSPEQGAMGLPTRKTILSADTLIIDASNLGINYKGVLASDSIVGTFTQNGFQLPLVLRKTEKPQLNRPQTPQAPFPYVSEEISFTNTKDKIVLKGTFTKPTGAGSFPTVILIAGSGPNDRNEEVFGHKPFMVIADYLTRNGIAVLRYDKRGVGESQGDFTKATVSDFARDAASVLAYLKTRKDVAKNSIGLLGHSEGGVVAPMVASTSKDVRFIVLMAAPGTSGKEIILDQNLIQLKQSNIEPETITRLTPLIEEMIDDAAKYDKTQASMSVLTESAGRIWENLPILIKLQQKKDVFVRNTIKGMTSDGYKSFLNTTPSVFLQKVKCPVFAINGEKDTQVPAEKNLAAIEKSLQSANNSNVTLKKYPNLNHLFQQAKTGSVSEYAQIEETISPEVLSDITQWILKHTK